MNKKKVVLITNLIPHYRIPVFNLLSENIDLTVVHFGNRVDEAKFVQKIVKKITISGFSLIISSLKHLLKSQDVVIVDFDFRVINHLLIALALFRNYKLIIWTIGVSASYRKKFDSDLKNDWIRFLFFKKSDSVVFYSEYPINKYVSNGFDEKKLFVAHNTVEAIEKINISTAKKHFLFIGTLYKEKGIIDLLDAYRFSLDKDQNLQPLIIIGTGAEKENIEKIIIENKLSKHIIMKGAIYNQNELVPYYRDAICTISPGQAGLSVLNSFSLGVPFVTTKDAITGGERLNIVSGENGYLYSEQKELIEILLLLSRNISLVEKLSKNAQDYYFKNRTLKNMVQGFEDSINYVTNNIKC